MTAARVLPTVGDCLVCYRAERGSWPATHRGTHCRDCHRSWTSRREIHCVTCHEHFGGEEGFTWHQKAGVCDPTARGRLTKDDSAVWRRPYGTAHSLRDGRNSPRNGARVRQGAEVAS